MPAGNLEVIKEGDGWVVRVEVGNGKVQTYHCATEQLARKLALALMPAAAKLAPPKP